MVRCSLNSIRRARVGIARSTVFISFVLHIEELDGALEYTIDCVCLLMCSKEAQAHGFIAKYKPFSFRISIIVRVAAV